MSPLVSVIIPYYNRPVKIVRCINSVLAQVYSNYEIIVVDDCSEIPYESHNERVQIVRNESNLGPGLSRNRGKAIAKGTYIAFLDSDDYWHPDFLKECVEMFSIHPNLSMVYTNSLKVSNGHIKEAKRLKNFERKTIIPDILFKGRAYATSACLWNMNSINNIDWVDTRNWEDYVFDVFVAIHNNDIISINKSLMFYEISGSDKLSKQKNTDIVKEKNKSIYQISERLLNSNFKEDIAVKKYISILIILNIVKLLKYRVEDKQYFEILILSISQWRTYKWSVFIFIIRRLPNRLAIRFLMSLKRKVNREKWIILD